MKLFLKIALSAFIIIVLIIAGSVFFITRGLDSGVNLEISAVNASSLEDGTYTGKYSAGRWSNEVSVIVKDNKIKEINIIKDVLFKQHDITEKIIEKVIEEQSTDVDAVSGATITCKAYLKSIEDALKN